MKVKEIINEDVSVAELHNVEQFADNLWRKFGIDVKFTKHFLNRVNDSRNKKPISAAELVRIFKKEYAAHAKQIATLDDGEQGVLRDRTTDINVPFAINDTPEEKDLVAKTVMRKPDFKTTNPEYVIQEKSPCWKGYQQIGMKDKDGKKVPNCVPLEETFDGDSFYECYGILEETLEEAEYQGRKVTLNKPMRSKDGPKKFHVFVKDPKTDRIKKVNFGDKNMRIKKHNPARRKSFRARHHCDNPGPKTKARYWSCKKW